MMTGLRNLLGAGLLLLMLGASWSQAGSLPLTVLHFNDFHGQLEAFTDSATGASVGGIARLAGAVQAVRAEDPQRPVILLFAGDLLQGTVTSSLFFGVPDLSFFSDMGVDAAVMGNHELDYGQDIFRKLLERARFPILSANVQAEPKPFPLQPYVILHPERGPRVAVLGLTTTELTTTTHPRNAVGLSVDDPVVVTQRWLPQLKAQADVVVVLSHLGIADDQRLAREAAGVDLIVGGHNHNIYASPVLTNGVPIVQAGDRGRYLGRLDLTVNDGRVEVTRYQLIPITADTLEDRRMAAAVHTIVAAADQELLVIIGRAEVDFDARREVIRRQESNFGDWVSDLARELTGADVALFNGGGFRTTIRAGDVSLKDVYQAFPFRNELVTGTLTGVQLQAALDRSASLDPQDNPGGFLQVSGLRYRIVAGKAQAVTVGGQPLDAAARYNVVMPDFLAEGGDGYAMLQDMDGKVATGRLISDVLIDAFRAKGTVTAMTDGRISRP